MDDETLRRLQARRVGSMDQKAADARDDLKALITNYRATAAENGAEQAMLSLLLSLHPGKHPAETAMIAAVAIRDLAEFQT